MSLFWTAITWANWAIAAAWSWRTLTALRFLPRVPDLTEDQFATPAGPADEPPRLTVVVPARNEATAIEATLRSLLAQTVPLRIIAVDDRSTDETGAIMDGIARQPLPAGKHLAVIHVTDLPEGWLGKNHALALAAGRADTEWLLFTDGDVLFAPDALARALRQAENVKAGHFVLLATPVLLTSGERMMISFFQILAAVGGNLWRVSDPTAKRDSIGIGAFNLLRREVYEGIGGFEALRMEVLEDLRLGYTVKQNGYRQVAAFGPGLVRLHWAAGAMGILGNLSKNAFAMFRFRLSFLSGGWLSLAALWLLPVAGWFGPWPCRWASAVTLGMQFLIYRYHRRFNDFPWWCFLAFPVAAVMFLCSILWSMGLTLWRGGVVWRGTFYPLRELRRHAGPIR